MKKLATYATCLLVAVAPGCGLMTQRQRSAACENIEAEYDAGYITRAQRDAAIDAIENPEGVDWDAIIRIGGGTLASLILGVPITIGAVQKIRGPSATREERVTRAAARKKQPNP